MEQELVGVTLGELCKVLRGDFIVPIPKSLADAVRGVTVSRVSLNLVEERLTSGATTEHKPVVKSTTDAPKIAFKLGNPSDLLEEE